MSKNQSNNNKNSNDQSIIEDLADALQRESINRVSEIINISITRTDWLKGYAFFECGRFIDKIDGGVNYLFKIIMNRYQKGETVSSLINCLSYTNGFEEMNIIINKYICNQIPLGFFEKINLLYGMVRSQKYKEIVQKLLLNIHNDDRKMFIEVLLEVNRIVNKMNDTEFSKKYINEICKNDNWDDYYKYQISSDILTDIIINTKDPEYIKSIYLDKQLLRKIGFKEDELILLASATKDKCIILEFFEDRNREEKLTQEQRSKLLLELNDKKEITKVISDPEKYGLDLIELLKFAFKAKIPIDEIKNCPMVKDNRQAQLIIAIYTKDDEYLESVIDEFEGEIFLPEDITIGIEIECVGRLSEVLMKRKKIDGWTCENDISVKDDDYSKGVEVISPILNENNAERTRKIKKIAGTLKKIEQHTNETCGGHIHIGANYLTTVQAFNNLEELWANNERILYIISNKEGELPRENIKDYAKPVSIEMESELENTIQINDDNDVESFKQRLADLQKKRNQGVNFLNLAENGKGTIEFRLSNGTVDPKVWIENINLYGGLVKAAQEISLIQKKTGELSGKEKKKLDLFNELGTNINLSEEERASKLIELIIDEEKNRQTYINRYKTNSALLKQEENKDLDDYLTEEISTTLIRYSDKKAIGKSLFTGKKPVTGSEMEEVTGFINSKLNKKCSWQHK